MEEEKIVINADSETAQAQEQHQHHHHHHHHHSHHGHHHHHHHRRRRSRKNSGKLLKFFKKNAKRIINILVIIVFVVILIAIAALSDNKGNPSQTTSNISGKEEQTLGSVKIEIPFFTEPVSLVTPAVEEYMSADNTKSVSQIYKKYKDDGRLDVALPVKLSYSCEGLSKDTTIISSVIEVADNKNFENANVYQLKATQRSVNVNFLKVATKYYYRVSITLADEQVISAEGSFVTADTPRIMKIGGIVNVRDIGGLKTKNGGRLKQGILYRGSELDGAVESRYKLTTQGVNDMLTVLGIKSDLDLRAEEENKTGTHALGNSAKHIYFDAPMYSEIFTDEGKKAIRNIFSSLADKSNYPAYLHCTYGTDRTGTVCYLLEALLGVNEDLLLKEYELSAMHHGGVSDEAMAAMIQDLKALSGSTMEQKVEGYLLSAGVTSQEIASIREIFLS